MYVFDSTRLYYKKGVNYEKANRPYLLYIASSAY